MKATRAFAVFALLYCSLAFADPELQPDDGFFSKDFADKVLSPEQADKMPQSKSSGEKNGRPPTPNPATPYRGSTKENNDGQTDFFGNAPPALKPNKISKTKAESATSAEDNGSGVPIKSITLLVQSSDSKKLSAAVRAYGRLLRTRNIQPKLVYVVANGGDPKESLARSSSALASEMQVVSPLSLEEVKKLSPEEAQDRIRQLTSSDLAKTISSIMLFNTVFSVPKEIPVTTLPSWVLSSEKGDIILEGIIDPASMITMSGNFVEPMIDIGGGKS